jgi:hypothetical protein
MSRFATSMKAPLFCRPARDAATMPADIHNMLQDMTNNPQPKALHPYSMHEKAAACANSIADSSSSSSAVDCVHMCLDCTHPSMILERCILSVQHSNSSSLSLSLSLSVCVCVCLCLSLLSFSLCHTHTHTHCTG